MRYTKVKSPVELVAGVLRLTGEFDRPRYEMTGALTTRPPIMGQMRCNNPPSVEGWHQGTDWLDSGTLVERINFASQQIGDADKPGIRDHDQPHQRPAQRVHVAGTAGGRLPGAGRRRWQVDESTRRTLVDFSAPRAAPAATPTGSTSPTCSKWWRPPRNSSGRNGISSPSGGIFSSLSLRERVGVRAYPQAESGRCSTQ